MRYGRLKNGACRISNRSKTATYVVVAWEWDEDWNETMNGMQIASVRIFKSSIFKRIEPSNKSVLLIKIKEALEIVKSIDLSNADYYQSPFLLIARNKDFHFQFYSLEDNKNNGIEKIALKDISVGNTWIKCEKALVEEAKNKLINKLSAFQTALRTML